MKKIFLVLLIGSLYGCGLVTRNNSNSIPLVKSVTPPNFQTGVFLPTVTLTSPATVTKFSPLALSSLLSPGEYLVDLAGSSNITIYAENGERQKLLTFDRNGILSPNLMYLENLPDVIDLTSGNIRHFNGLDGCGDPSWSPDSNFIVAECWNETISDLYLLSMSDNTVKRITICSDKSFLCDYPSWSPDGKLIVYYLFGGISGSNASIEGLHLLNTQCLFSSTTCTLDAVGRVISPNSFTWSPDSHYIAGTTESEISIFQIESNSAVPSQSYNLSPSVVGLISWSPNGKWIAANTNNGVVLVSIDTGKISSLSDITSFNYWISVP
jgi:hypothetical protein